MSDGNRKGPASGSGAVVVVGTTPDYILKLYERYSKALVFLTDRRFELDPLLQKFPSSALIFASLERPEEARQITIHFLRSRHVQPAGIACFDCDSLLLASELASDLKLKFPSWQAIYHSRNKFETRKIWTANGVASPLASLTTNLQGTLAFFEGHKRNMVLKPVAGSGSELLFHCRTEAEVRVAVSLLEEELPKRRVNPLFRPFPNPAGGPPVDPCGCWVAEEYVSGPEFSCDFVLQKKEIFFIRETGKIKATDKPFGSVLAYTFPPRYPSEFQQQALKEVLKKATTALGFDWGYFMVDFILHDSTPVLIEMTPRPGGDSIPELVRAASGLDTLAAYLEFVQDRFTGLREVKLPAESFASLNFYALKQGTIKAIHGEKVHVLPHVRGLFFKKKEGDRVLLPPKDYDHRLLGYCIIKVAPGSDIVLETQRLEQLLEVMIEENA